MCMKTEAEMYRRLESDCDRDDGGCTGGSLFWVRWLAVHSGEGGGEA